MEVCNECALLQMNTKKNDEVKKTKEKDWCKNVTIEEGFE